MAPGRRLLAVRGTRGLTRSSLARNRDVAPVEVDVRDGSVSLDGRPLVVDPVREVPLSRRYLLR
jgi:urease subunit alpha